MRTHGVGCGRFGARGILPYHATAKRVLDLIENLTFVTVEAARTTCDCRIHFPS
jgi:hypothetical protein